MRRFTRKKTKDQMLEIEGQLLLGQKGLPPGDGWRRISSAPWTSKPSVEVWNGKEIVRCHYACDLSGEEQPPFQGWFVPVLDSKGQVSYNYEVTPAPTHWRPIDA